MIKLGIKRMKSGSATHRHIASNDFIGAAGASKSDVEPSAVSLSCVEASGVCGGSLSAFSVSRCPGVWAPGDSLKIVFD